MIEIKFGKRGLIPYFCSPPWLVQRVKIWNKRLKNQVWTVFFFNIWDQFHQNIYKEGEKQISTQMFIEGVNSA